MLIFRYVADGRAAIPSGFVLESITLALTAGKMSTKTLTVDVPEMAQPVEFPLFLAKSARFDRINIST